MVGNSKQRITSCIYSTHYTDSPVKLKGLAGSRAGNTHVHDWGRVYVCSLHGKAEEELELELELGGAGCIQNYI